MPIAALVTWAAVSYAVWFESAQWPAIAMLSAQHWAGLLLGVFLAAVLVLSWVPWKVSWRPWSSVTIAVQIAAAFGLLALGPQSTSPVLLIIIAAELMFLYPLRLAWLVLMILNLLFLGVLVFRWNADNPLFAFALYGGFQAFAALSAGAMKRAEAAAAALRLANAELLATRSLLAESARDGERLRMSRELHDVAGHKLTALTLNLELLRIDKTLADRHEFKVVRQLSTELLSDVRSVVSSLRRDDGVDLRDALERLAEVFPRPHVHLQFDAGLRIDGAERAEVILRCAQEALTNAARHASADHVWLSLTQAAGFTQLVVEDDGAFSGRYAIGNGLAGMRERLEQLGGVLDLGGGARCGFRVVARLPEERPA